MQKIDRDALRDLFLQEDATGQVVPRYEVLRTVEEVAGEIEFKLSADKCERRCQISDLGSALNFLRYWALDEGWNWVQFVRPNTKKDNGRSPVVYGFTRKQGPTKLYLARLDDQKLAIETTTRRAIGVARENNLLPETAKGHGRKRRR